ISAPFADPEGHGEAGESYVVFGRTSGFPAAFELPSLLPAVGGDGSAGFILRGIDSYDESGRSVSRAGVINGDGVEDLIIGASYADPNDKDRAGETYVVFGRTIGFPAVFKLRSLDPAFGGDGGAGFILRGVDPRDFSGASVGSAGDVNGDGIDDLMIGAPEADPNSLNAGESYVVFGRTTGFPADFELRSLYPAAGGDGSAGFILQGINFLDYSGHFVTGAGDINGDGIDDLLIGALHAGASAGESYLVFGRAIGFPAV